MSFTAGPSSSDWAFDEEAFLKKLPYPVVPTNIRGVYSGVAPPDDFDPNTATPHDLIKHGILWRRPNETDPLAYRDAWQRAFSRKWLAKDRIIPVSIPTGRKRCLAKAPFKKQRDGTYLSYLWSGAATASGGPYAGVFAFWKIPNVSAAPQPPSQPGSKDYDRGIAYDSSSWVGIDGYTFASNDVLQAGVEQYVDTHGVPHYVAWYEWVGPVGPPPHYVNQMNISNMPISAGDSISVSVQYVGKTAGQIYFANYTTGKHVSHTLSPPKAVSFSGDSVEWIMEDPDEGAYSGTALATFSPVEFTCAAACNAGSYITNQPPHDDTMNIETLSGTVLTKTTLREGSVRITFVG